MFLKTDIIAVVGRGSCKWELLILTTFKDMIQSQYGQNLAFMQEWICTASSI